MKIRTLNAASNLIETAKAWYDAEMSKGQDALGSLIARGRLIEAVEKLRQAEKSEGMDKRLDKPKVKR